MKRLPTKLWWRMVSYFANVLHASLHCSRCILNIQILFLLAAASFFVEDRKATNTTKQCKKKDGINGKKHSGNSNCFLESKLFLKGLIRKAINHSKFLAL